MAPERDWSWLKALVWRLARNARPKPKHDRIVFSDRLIRLGCRLMDGAAGLTNARQAALQYRDGLLIALLATRALRRRNITDLHLGRNLVRIGDGYHLLFGPHETKEHRSIDAPVPALLVPYVERYLAEVRPRFSGADRHDGLWASCKAGPMHEEAVYECVRARTRRAFGRPINLHLFRDCAATTIATRDPANVRIAGPLLTHSDLRTTHKYYIQAGQLQAVRELHAALAALSDSLRPLRASRRNPRR